MKAICQFDPPAENTVAKLTNSQFSLFLDSCEYISDWGNLWVQLSFEVVICTFTFAFTATMHVFFIYFLHVCFFCRHLRHIKWLLHVVSEEAVKSRVGNVRAFAGDLHAFRLFFIFFRKGVGQILSSSASLKEKAL